jgi:hypothetical protein
MTQSTSPGQSPLDSGIDAALANPSACFAQPHDVLAHPGLSRALQLKILQQWEIDARGLAEAESEGMGGGEDSMLGRVRQAIDTLERPQAANMRNAAGRAQPSIGATARRVADGLQDAATHVQQVAASARSGIAEIRQAFRAQPITAALAVFAVGYLCGDLRSRIPARRPSGRRR